MKERGLQETETDVRWLQERLLMAKVKFSGAFEGTPSRGRGGATFTPAPARVVRRSAHEICRVAGHESDCTAPGQASRRRQPSSSSTLSAPARGG
jgi:hypothetical protein